MPYTLQILHASDFEAGLLATERAGNFAAIVDRLEDSTPNSITLTSGDSYIPSPFFIAGGDPQLNATYRGVYNQLFGLSGANSYQALTASAGRADITILNILGVQANVFGNHEFDATTTEIRNIIGANLGAAAGPADDVWVGAFFPYLSTNLNFSLDTGTSGTNDLVSPLTAPPATFALTGPTSTRTGVLEDKIAKSTVITENGERILYVGATTQVLPLISSTGNVTVEGFSGRDDIPLLATQINAEIDRALAANPGINKVIVGTHLQQLTNEQTLAPLLRNVDVLIGGGSNTRLSDANDRLLPGDVSQGAYPTFYTNASGQPIALVNTDGEYSYLGRLTLTFDDNGIVVPSSVDVNTSGAVAVDATTVNQLYGSRAAAFAPGSKGFLVQEIIEGLDANNDGVQETLGVADIIRQQDGNILGRTSVYLEGRRTEVRTEESNLGDLSADANLFYGKQFDSRVAVSIKNGGGIRDSIGSFASTGGGTAELPPAANAAAGKAAGDISQLDVTNSLRFNNSLSLITVTAAELEIVLEHAVSATAAGATPGQFPQIGGVQFSFDATQQAQTTNTLGQVTREGQRIKSAALIDENGKVIDILVQDGRVVGDPNRDIRVVTLDFLAVGTVTAPGLGGDNYPFPALGSDRVDLRTATATIPNAATFAAQGTEQDALAEYLKAKYSAPGTAFGLADTTPALDTRIENLAFRSDAVFNSAPVFGSNTAADTIEASIGNDVLNGGTGIFNDTLVFRSVVADNTVATSGPFDVVVGPSGRDTVVGFERVQFNDATFLVADGSPLVDDLFYNLRNKDVFRAGVDADTHYGASGFREGRDPNALFSTNGYLSANPDVRQAGVDPLKQFDAVGWKDGRDPSIKFDVELYLKNAPDVRAAGVDPLAHYVQFGEAEGRQVSAAIGTRSEISRGFDKEYYLLANPDVGAAGVDARTHFDLFGAKEGRNPNAFFDTAGYLAANQDVAKSGINPLTHYDLFGFKEGRDPSRDFDTSSYLAANPDVAAAGVDPLQHYLQFGALEGRSSFADGFF